MANRSPFSSETQDRFMIRLPDGLRDQLKSRAAENGRTMSAEIVKAIEAWLQPDATEERLTRLERAVFKETDQ